MKPLLLILGLFFCCCANCQLSKDKLAALGKYYNIKDIGKKEQLSFNGELISSNRLPNKLYKVVAQSPTTNEKKIFVSPNPMNKKDYPPHQVLQIQYRLLQNVKTKKIDMVVVGSMEYMNL